jgi:hypothetical protein
MACYRGSFIVLLLTFTHGCMLEVPTLVPQVNLLPAHNFLCFHPISLKAPHSHPTKCTHFISKWTASLGADEDISKPGMLQSASHLALPAVTDGFTAPDSPYSIELRFLLHDQTILTEC